MQLQYTRLVIVIGCLLAPHVDWTLAAEDCHFNQYMNSKVVSQYSAVLHTITSIADCLAYLKENKLTHKVVAFDARTSKCCSVLQTLAYQIEPEPGWTTFEIRDQTNGSNSSPPSSTTTSTSTSTSTTTASSSTSSSIKPKYAIFTTNENFTSPSTTSKLKVLVVGGGAGGSNSNGGGGGSGFVSFAVLSVVPGQTYQVVIGKGGNYDKNGSSTIFGNDLLVAHGGTIKPNNCDGGSGGSGGGTGCANPSGNGGSAGSAGQKTGYNAGSGQGSSFTSYFSQFELNTLTAGPGAPVTGYLGTSPGGGGAGGVLINGTGPKSGNSDCYIGGVWYGPGPASGYGAGGSGGCSANSYIYGGGKGANGMVYIEY